MILILWREGVNARVLSVLHMEYTFCILLHWSRGLGPCALLVLLSSPARRIPKEYALRIAAICRSFHCFDYLNNTNKNGWLGSAGLLDHCHCFRVLS